MRSESLIRRLSGLRATEPNQISHAPNTSGDAVTLTRHAASVAVSSRGVQQTRRSQISPRAIVSGAPEQRRPLRRDVDDGLQDRVPGKLKALKIISIVLGHIRPENLLRGSDALHLRPLATPLLRNDESRRREMSAGRRGIRWPARNPSHRRSRSIATDACRGATSCGGCCPSALSWALPHRPPPCTAMRPGPCRRRGRMRWRPPTTTSSLVRVRPPLRWRIDQFNNAVQSITESVPRCSTPSTWRRCVDGKRPQHCNAG